MLHERNSGQCGDDVSAIEQEMRVMLEDGVADGTRTHDNRNHNPGLYQLSYSHHCTPHHRPRAKRNSILACPTGIEPATAGLEGRCSIRLSYGHSIGQQNLVGVERFELPTSWSQTRRATRLRYTPLCNFFSSARPDATGCRTSRHEPKARNIPPAFPHGQRAAPPFRNCLRPPGISAIKAPFQKSDKPHGCRTSEALPAVQGKAARGIHEPQAARAFQENARGNEA